MRKVFVVVALLLTTTTAFGKTRDYEFKEPCGHVWAAIRDVLMKSGKYGILFMNDKDMTASYNIGGFMGGKRTNSAVLTPKGDGCNMSIQTAFTGLAHNDAGDFNDRVKEAIGRVPAPSPEAAPAEKPAAEAAPAEAKIEVASKPEGADIEVDGSFVGNTPSTVGVKPGEHTVKVSKKGFKPWERKITTSSGTVKLSPELDQEMATQEAKPQK